MMPVGYMYKKISLKPDWLTTDQAQDIYSVSACISEDIADWIKYWHHNGYWFFDSPEIIENIANQNNISLAGMKLFYYTAYEKQWDDEAKKWVSYEPEPSFATNVLQPGKTRL